MNTRAITSLSFSHIYIYVCVFKYKRMYECMFVFYMNVCIYIHKYVGMCIYVRLGMDIRINESINNRMNERTKYG